MGMSLRCEIFPDDLDATIQFYVDVLGFTVVRDGHASDSPYVAFERDQVRLGAASRRAVADPDARRPWGVADFRLIDPAGYYLRLTERADQAG